ncbi:hypothetical protein M422DRAFT_273178 [Sphaerobolus stellatus SS14]|uniref:F-box domain-containing protein n=1 Tax=Sphaerobolus stellatus (strain SS14) TaxID=990650 RepID=A0A0C9UKB7_SPHS4|nr:hypothetical protein M422DRAFT_273178 [Sphaerobolus stellatus SS14]
MATRKKPLPDLPFEIVHTICDELRNTKDLLALGLTHRRFTHVACNRHLKYMKIEAPVTHYDFWKYVECVPAFRARARELTLLPVSPFNILVPPIPSIPPVVSSVIPFAAVTVIPSPTLPAGPSATTSAMEEEDQTKGQVQAAEVEEEPTPDNAIFFFQTLTQLQELRSLRIEHCTLPQEFQDEHFMLVKQTPTSISSAAHFDTLELWDGTCTPELQWSRMPLLLASNIARISLDFTMKDVGVTFPPQLMHGFLVKSCPMLQKLKICVQSGSLNSLKPVLSGTWPQLNHLTLFERNAMTLLPNAAAPSTIQHLIYPYTRNMNKRRIIGQFQELESFEGEARFDIDGASSMGEKHREAYLIKSLAFMAHLQQLETLSVSFPHYNCLSTPKDVTGDFSNPLFIAGHRLS